MEPREYYPRKPLAWTDTGAAPHHRNGLVEAVSPGSKNTA